MAGHYKSSLRQNDFWDIHNTDHETHPRVGLFDHESVSQPTPLKSDRRHHPRRGETCRVDYADTGRFVGVGLIKNVSMDGMFMEHVPDLVVGDRVTTAFRLPSSPPFKLKATVKWVNSEGAGLQFVGLSKQITGLFSGNLEADCISVYRLWLCQN